MNNAGNCIEIEAVLDMQKARAAEMRVLSSDDGREHTDITITRRPENRSEPIGLYPYIPDQTARVYVSINSINASLHTNIWPRAAETLDTIIPIDEAIKLRVFIDVCVVEIFLNDRLVLSETIYPSLPSATNASIKAIGGDIRVKSFASGI